MYKLKSIEGIRAIAALLVMLFHIQTTVGLQIRYALPRDLIAGGHRGVDLFFVLSGFIIAYVHAKDLGQPGRLKNYFYNRIARIYPAVWIMSFAAAAVYSFGIIAPEKLSKLNFYSVLASFLLLPQQGVPLVNVTWTLTNEMFFYVLFSIAIINAKMGFAAILIWQLMIAVTAVFNIDLGMHVYYLNPICLDFTVGLIGAWLVHHLTDRSIPLSIWIALLALGFAGFVIGILSDEAHSRAAILCAVSAGAIIVSLAEIDQAGRSYMPKFLVTLGGASYAVYLVHFSVIQVLAYVLKRIHVSPSDLLYFVYVPVGISAGLLFDAWIDKPIQKYLRKIRPLIIGCEKVRSHANIYHQNLQIVAKDQ